MSSTAPTLPEACRALGLRCRCEASKTEPRFSLTIEPTSPAQTLVLTIRDDGSVQHAVTHLDLDVPGVLLSLTEDTVQREPVLDLWLPHEAVHRFLIFRAGDQWRVEPMPGLAPPATVRDAVTRLDDPRR